MKANYFSLPLNAACFQNSPLSVTAQKGGHNNKSRRKSIHKVRFWKANITSSISKESRGWVRRCAMWGLGRKEQGSLSGAKEEGTHFCFSGMGLGSDSAISPLLCSFTDIGVSETPGTTSGFSATLGGNCFPLRSLEFSVSKSQTSTPDWLVSSVTVARVESFLLKTFCLSSASEWDSQTLFVPSGSEFVADVDIISAKAMMFGRVIVLLRILTALRVELLLRSESGSLGSTSFEQIFWSGRPETWE